jgi:hypothetical protein
MKILAMMKKQVNGEKILAGTAKENYANDLQIILYLGRNHRQTNTPFTPIKFIKTRQLKSNTVTR